MITAIAIDDEPLALQLVADYIQKTPDLMLAGQFENACSLLTGLGRSLVREGRFQLINNYLMNITKESIDKLNSVVRIDITTEDYQNKVESVLKDYRNKANIPGFRKGHVPMSFVKKQYGKSVVIDEVNKLLQDALSNYLIEEKLDVLGNPLPKIKDDFSWDADTFSFEFELGLAPEFEIDLKPKKPISVFKIVADDKMIDDQISRLQEQYGKTEQKETIGEADNIHTFFQHGLCHGGGEFGIS